MNQELYEMIFKRKSFHVFAGVGDEKITEEELKDIEAEFEKIKPLVEDIDVKIKIVKNGTNCKVGQEYCVLFYSEKKENYLQNIGYMGAQLDLYLVSKNIGTLWCGIAKPEEQQLDGLDYVIMLAIRKVDSTEKFRKDLFKTNRKDFNVIWQGDYFIDVGNMARFAPSACNSQPWRVETMENELKVYRHKGKLSIMPKEMMKYFNQIDMGIFLSFLELCMAHENIAFEREVFEEKDHDAEDNLTAAYMVK